MPAALGALTVAAPMIGMKYGLRAKIPSKYWVSGIAAGAGLGFFAPDAANIAIRLKNKKITPRRAEKQLSELHEFQGQATSKAKEIVSRYHELNKNAGLFGAGRKILNVTLGKGGIIPKATGVWWHEGIMGPGRDNFGKKIKRSLGEHVFSGVTRVGTAAAVGAAGTAGYKALSAPRSTSNYNTFLRNNILSGSIKPNELSATDSRYVQQLGMK
jgi:hypothetical protein